MTTPARMKEYRDISLDAIGSYLADVPGMAAEWDDLDSGEQASLAIEWDDLVKRLEALNADRAAGELTAKQERRHDAILSELEGVSKALQRIDFPVPAFP